MIQKKIEAQYPFVPPALAQQLVSVVRQNRFYSSPQQGNIMLHMTPLLQFLDASNKPTHRAIAQHLRGAVPLPGSWRDTLDWMAMAYRNRHRLYCKDASAHRDMLVIRKGADELVLLPDGSSKLNGVVLSAERGLPSERLRAMDVFRHYLKCVRSATPAVGDKGHVIGQIVLGPQRIRYLTPAQVSGARATSKPVSVRRHPVQQHARALREKVRIPTHVIAACGLDRLVSECPQIPSKVYEDEVLPRFSGFHAEGHYQTTTDAAGVNQLVAVLFGGRNVVCYIIYKDNDEWVLEVQVRCRGVVQGGRSRCLFSARFYNDFVEYTATFFDKTRIIRVLEGNECCFLHYNRHEEDSFLGWDADEHTEQQRQRARRQVLQHGRLPELHQEQYKNVLKFVRLLHEAVQEQKEGRTEPLYQSES